MKDGGILPGDTSRSYLRITPLILLFIAPFFGVALVFFLPLFGIGVFIALCLLMASSALSATASAAVRLCCDKRTSRAAVKERKYSGAYQPLRASFTGTQKRKTGKK
ncbi:MAG TPA: hypothetical protein VK452_04485 [Dissulfurispiraceae bacterium]|nr:hypothetical protein [Dissulfurispiraceae bacterium]